MIYLSSDRSSNLEIGIRLRVMRLDGTAPSPKPNHFANIFDYENGYEVQYNTNDNGSVSGQNKNVLNS